MHFRDGIQQHPGVRVARRGKQSLLAGQLHQPPKVHHAHVIADMAHHCQVVADKQIGQAALFLQVFHDVEHLRLHTHVQCTGGLVTDQKLGIRSQGAGNRNALALPTGELVRVFRHVQRTQAHRLQQVADFGLQLGCVIDDAVLFQRLANDVFDYPARIQRRIGILKNHLDAFAQFQASGASVSRMGIHTVKVHAAARGLVQTHHEFGHGAFAATGLSHQRQGFAFFNLKGHAIDGLQKQLGLALNHTGQQTGRHVKCHCQVGHRNQGPCRPAGLCRHAATPSFCATSQQAARVAPAGANTGRSILQRSKTCGQRGLKAQPMGMAFRRGMAPSI